MKSILLLSASYLMAGTIFAQHEVSCSYTAITTDIVSNTTLSAATLYQINGCVHVTSGNTLTVPASTVIMGQKSSTGTLIVDAGARLILQGTAANPVVFTSNQEDMYRAPGDWGGIVLLGNATNNVSGGTIAISDRNCSVSAGNSNDADSSGSLAYARIEYPVHGLTLISQGSKTVLDHIQVSKSSDNAFEFLGGVPQIRYPVSFDATRDDYFLSYGARVKMQYALAFRKNGAAYDATNNSYGIRLENDPSGTSNTPTTHLTASNVLVLGPGFCNGTVNSAFKDALLTSKNARIDLYNSVLSYFGDNGFRIESAGSVGSTLSDNSNFSANTMVYNGSNPYYSATTWSSACESSIGDWLEPGLGAANCAETGNQTSVTNLGYSSAICSTTTPDFRLGTNNLDAADFSFDALDDDFFSEVAYRGAFGTSTNWVADWTNFDPQTTEYCLGMKATTVGTMVKGTTQTGFQLSPNPAHDNISVSLNLVNAEKVTLTITNSIGQIVVIENYTFSAGNQHVNIMTGNFRPGLYMVRLSTQTSIVGNQKLIIK